MRTFTYMDHVNGVCSVAEIDTPWISRWSSADAAMGLCEADMIGMLKPAPDAPGPDEPMMSDDIFNIEMAAYRSDPARYRTTNASNLNKLLDVAARRQEKREEKAPQIALDKLSAADLQKMSLSELKLILVNVVMEHVPEDRREAALVVFRQG